MGGGLRDTWREAYNIDRVDRYSIRWQLVTSPWRPQELKPSVLIEASIHVDAPSDDIYDILTEYGSDVRLRINPALKKQQVIERGENEVLCENEWERDGKRIRQQRRYRLSPKERIDEEVIGTDQGMVRVSTKLEPEDDGTRLTVISEYHFRGLWGLAAKLAANKLREDDELLLQTLKEHLEAEFEEVEES